MNVLKYYIAEEARVSSNKGKMRFTINYYDSSKNKLGICTIYHDSLYPEYIRIVDKNGNAFNVDKKTFNTKYKPILGKPSSTAYENEDGRGYEDFESSDSSKKEYDKLYGKLKKQNENAYDYSIKNKNAILNDLKKLVKELQNRSEVWKKAADTYQDFTGKKDAGYQELLNKMALTPDKVIYDSSRNRYYFNVSDAIKMSLSDQIIGIYKKIVSKYKEANLSYNEEDIDYLWGPGKPEE